MQYYISRNTILLYVPLQFADSPHASTQLTPKVKVLRTSVETPNTGEQHVATTSGGDYLFSLRNVFDGGIKDCSISCDTFAFIIYVPLKSTDSLLASVNVSSSLQLTPKAKRLYCKARRLQNKAYTYRHRARNFRKRLSRAQKCYVDLESSSLRHEAVQFLLHQLSRKKTKPRGRRFALDEKLMALALYKISGPAYRFLSRWFHLPSRPTLSRVLQRVPITSGINEYLIENLKKTVKHMQARERLCILMFDEISLSPHVTYNKHRDCLVGIDGGEICDHALVFMVRGITRKWKQVVAYTFCKGSTKPALIKGLLKSLVEQLKNAGR